jgi:cytochrome c oxidase assembly protein subunit 15
MTTTDSTSVVRGSAAAPITTVSPSLVLPSVVCGFGVAVLMWAIGYVTHLRPGLVAGPIVFGLLLLVLLAGGWIAGRAVPTKAVRAGASVGAIASLINLLIIGSIVSGEGGGGELAVAALGSIAAAAGLSAIAGWFGGRRVAEACPMRRLDAADWRHAMVCIAATATFFVVIAGGLVTSTETGLAVPDWPNTFGSNMFAYPLEKMVGGIYYEHAHRLYGALVGMCTVAAAILINTTGEPRRWVRRLAAAAVIMVIAQGLMGGLRVTGTLTTAVEGPTLAPNTGLAIAHGIFGQCFLATMVAMAAITSRAWRQLPLPDAEESPIRRAAAGGTLTTVLLVLLVVQLATGAGYRHTYTVEQKLPWPAHLHLTLAMVVVILCFVGGLKAWSRTRDMDRPLRRSGLAMMILVTLQTLLGGAALIAILARTDEPYLAEVLLATAHQANGALVLAAAGLMFAWTRRLPAPLTDEERVAAGETLVRTSTDNFDEELRGAVAGAGTPALRTPAE